MTQLIPPGNNILASSGAGEEVRTSTRGTFYKSMRATFQAVVVMLLSVVLIEGFLSISHIGEQEYLKVDPVLGFMHLENKLVTDRTEAFAISQMNSQGLNDYEHNMIKEPGTVRIAVLGDSIVEALQVPIEQRFTSVLQSELNKTPGHRFEVMNFGTGGYSTGQEYLQYVRDVRQYKPDVVLLLLHQGDEEENGPVESKWSLRPTFALDPAAQLLVRWQEFDTWRNSRSADPLILFDWGRRHSHIWQALLQIHDSVKNDYAFKRIYSYASAASNRLSAFIISTVPSWRDKRVMDHNQSLLQLQTARDNLCREASMTREIGAQQPVYDQSRQWRLELRLLAAFNFKCVQDHSKFVVASFPAIEKPVSSRQVFERRLLYLQQFAHQCGFQTVDISSTITHAENTKTDPLFLLAHLSARGHKLVAQNLVKTLTSQP